MGCSEGGDHDCHIVWMVFITFGDLYASLIMSMGSSAKALCLLFISFFIPSLFILFYWNKNNYLREWRHFERG